MSGLLTATVGVEPPPVISDRLQQVVSERRELARLIVAHLPVSGAAVGNQTMRRITKTMTNPDYVSARDELRRVGVIRLGYGRGGSLALAEDLLGGTVGGSAPTGGLETFLYPAIRQHLLQLLNDEGRFERDPVVEITGVQGGRKSIGKWTRPDITVVGHRRFKVLAGAHLEVHTYEVKTFAGFKIDALHEARAHRRRAHRSFVLVDLEVREQEDEVRSYIDEARDLGVGLVSFLSISDEWSIWVDAPFNQPDPVDLDYFLDTQLSESAKAIIHSWQALPALGAD